MATPPERKPAPPPPTEQPQTPSGGQAAAGLLGIATADAAAKGAAAPVAAIPAAYGALAATVLNALDGFFNRKRQLDAEWLVTSLHATYPLRPLDEVQQAAREEIDRERAFQMKARKRLEGKLREAGKIADEHQRAERVMTALATEQRYVRMRQEAMATRAAAAMERYQLKRLSPEGAYWKLSPVPKTHTLDCLFMAGKWWPWSVLDQIHPPLHNGCPCKLFGMDEAKQAGLVPKDFIPPKEAEQVRKAREGMEAIRRTLNEARPDEIEAALDELVLVEAGRRGLTSVAPRGVAWLGVAGPGDARQGEARRGPARPGEAGTEARRGRARRGEASQGEAGLGEARYDLRYPKGTKGGQFRPRRGSIRPSVRRLLAKVFPGLPGTERGGEPKRRLHWLRGQLVDVTRKEQSFEVNGSSYRSPEGSLAITRLSPDPKQVVDEQGNVLDIDAHRPSRAESGRHQPRGRSTARRRRPRGPHTQGGELPIPPPRNDVEALRRAQDAAESAGPATVPGTDPPQNLVRPDFAERVRELRRQPGMGNGALVSRWLPDWGEDERSGQADALAEMGHRLGMDPEQYERWTTSKLKRLLAPERSQVALRLYPERLEKLLVQGELGAPTGTHPDARPQGYYDRRLWEDEVFGDHPIYGYMAERDEDVAANPVKAFGEVKLTLKPSVRERTTFVYSDSNYVRVGQGTTLPAPVNDPDAGAVPYSFNVAGVDRLTMQQDAQPRPEPPMPPEVAERIERTAPDMGDAVKGAWLRELEDQGKWTRWAHGDFFEAQIHGGVKLADVESVEFEHDPPGETKAALDKAGIPWSIYPDRPGGPHDRQEGEAIDVGSDVQRAADLLAEGKKVKLDQPRTVSVLLDELGARVRKMREAGERAPDFNLCNVTVRGTNLFCAESKGVPRVQMPQLKGVPTPGTKAAEIEPDVRGEVDLTHEFRKRLEAKGVKISDSTSRVSYLRATQVELVGAKVASMTKFLDEGSEFDPALDYLVSREDYIVDGHHRWAALIGHDAADGVIGDDEMPVARVDMDIIDLLEEAKAFSAEWGLPQADTQSGFGVTGMTNEVTELRKALNRPVWQQRRKEYVGPFPDAPELPDGQPDYGDETFSGLVRAHREREQRYDREVKFAISRGDTDEEQAKALGWKGESNAEVGGGYKLLPRRLWHVTTNRPAVERDGVLKTRDDLTFEHGAPGLGGGTSDTISFTTNAELATDIRDAMLLAGRVTRGEVTIQDLLDQARKGEGAEKPWLTTILSGGDYGSRAQWKEGDPLPENVQKLLDEVRVESNMAKTAQELAAEGARPYGKPVIGADGTPRYLQRAIPMTEEQKVDNRMRFLKHWLFWRDQAGGPDDPLFFTNDPQAALGFTPQTIGIVEVAPTAKARGYNVGGMGEWRVHTGEVTPIVALDAFPPGTTAVKPRMNVIAIDGPAAAGKSPIADRVAKLLGGLHVDSGSFYRIGAWASIGGSDPKEAVDRLTRTGDRYYIDGREVTSALREPYIADEAARLSQDEDFSAHVRKRIAQIADSRPLVVVDGRDSGASLRAGTRIYLTASPDERDVRRERDLRERDRIDEPKLKVAREEGVPIDTTGDDFDKVAQRIVSIYRGGGGMANTVDDAEDPSAAIIRDPDAGETALRAAMFDRISRGEPPLVPGAGTNAFEVLVAEEPGWPDVNFTWGATRTVTRRDGYHTLLRSRAGDLLDVIRSREDLRVTEVRYEPAVERNRERSEGLPVDEAALTADTLGKADELGERFGAAVRVNRINWHNQQRGDTNGEATWDGLLNFGPDLVSAIDRARTRRLRGQPLSDSDREDLYLAYAVLAHEVAHSVNPISARDYGGGWASAASRRRQGGRAMEEALTEETAHQLTLDYLREHGFEDVIAWANANPEHSFRQGTYHKYRAGLGRLFDVAGITDPEERKATLLRMKFQMGQQERMDFLAERLDAAKGADWLGGHHNALVLDWLQGNTVVGEQVFAPVLSPPTLEQPRVRLGDGAEVGVDGEVVLPDGRRATVVDADTAKVKVIVPEERPQELTPEYLASHDYEADREFAPADLRRAAVTLRNTDARVGDKVVPLDPSALRAVGGPGIIGTVKNYGQGGRPSDKVEVAFPNGVVLTLHGTGLMRAGLAPHLGDGNGTKIGDWVEGDVPGLAYGRQGVLLGDDYDGSRKLYNPATGYVLDVLDVRPAPAGSPLLAEDDRDPQPEAMANTVVRSRHRPLALTPEALRPFLNDDPSPPWVEPLLPVEKHGLHIEATTLAALSPGDEFGAAFPYGRTRVWRVESVGSVAVWASSEGDRRRFNRRLEINWVRRAGEPAEPPRERPTVPPVDPREPHEMTLAEFVADPPTRWHGTKWGGVGEAPSPLVHLGDWRTAHDALTAQVGLRSEPELRVPERLHGRTPLMVPVRVVGPMASGRYRDYLGDHTRDEGPSAEGLLRGMLKRGVTPRQGYYYVNEGEGARLTPYGVYNPVSAVVPDSTWLRTHEDFVRQALLDGREVRPEVLADYPDLAATGMANTVDAPERTVATPETLGAVNKLKPGEMLRSKALPGRVVVRHEDGELVLKAGAIYGMDLELASPESAASLLDERPTPPGDVEVEGTLLDLPEVVRMYEGWQHEGLTARVSSAKYGYDRGVRLAIARGEPTERPGQLTVTGRLVPDERDPRVSGDERLREHPELAETAWGEFEATYTRRKDGTWEARHDLLHVFDQGKGIGSSFSDYREQQYRKYGVSKVTLHASMSAGAYVWARKGYRFRNMGEEWSDRASAKGLFEARWFALEDELGNLDDPPYPQVTREQLEDFALHFAGIRLTETEFDGMRYLALVDPDAEDWGAGQNLYEKEVKRGEGGPYFESPQEIAMYGVENAWDDPEMPDGKNWLGKLFLLGAEWDGEKRLEPEGMANTPEPLAGTFYHGTGAGVADAIKGEGLAVDPSTGHAWVTDSPDEARLYGPPGDTSVVALRVRAERPFVFDRFAAQPDDYFAQRLRDAGVDPAETFWSDALFDKGYDAIVYRRPNGTTDVELRDPGLAQADGMANTPTPDVVAKGLGELVRTATLGEPPAFEELPEDVRQRYEGVPSVRRLAADLYRRGTEAPPPEGFGYLNAEDFVVKRGKGYLTVRSAEEAGLGDYRGRLGDCFKNATDAILGMDASVPLPEGYRYVEGFAYKAPLPFPIHHAWLEGPDGEAVDLTWLEPGEAYLGTPFDKGDVLRSAMTRGWYGLFDVEGDDPLLRRERT